MASLRGAVIALIITVVTIVLAIAQYAVVLARPRSAAVIPQLYHRFVLRLLDVRLDIDGTIADGPVLIVANHASWLDIPIIGSIAKLSFIAKREVASWPGFGTMAKLQRTVFVNRERRSETRHAKSEIERRLTAGDRLVLFAEGTSSDGNRVLPFRTALFGVAGFEFDEHGETRRLPVQPLSLAYTRLHGLPLGRQYRPRFAWYGDMDMVRHLWGVLCSGPIDVKLVLHPPVTLDEFGDRKALARHCEARVRAGVLSALLGRPVRADDTESPVSAEAAE